MVPAPYPPEREYALNQSDPQGNMIDRKRGIIVFRFSGGHASWNRWIGQKPSVSNIISFVAGVPDRPDDVSVVNAIFAMARGLDLKVVAEGVERRTQLDFIRAHRCDFAQGWLFSKALDEVQYRAYLEGANAGVRRLATQARA